MASDRTTVTGGHVNTVRANADAIAALPDDEFRRDDLCPALRETLDDLMSTPIIETVEQIREGEVYRNIYAVVADAQRLAEETVAQRDAVCPCGHAGLRNRGGFYECSFDGCSQQFDREHLATVEVRADGGWVTCCPDCDSSQIRVGSSSTINRDEPLPQYHCHDCDARFDEPAERRRQTTTSANSGTAAAALEAAEPDVVPDGGTKRLPWCDNCDAFAVPEDGVCVVCGTEIRYRERVP